MTKAIVMDNCINSQIRNNRIVGFDVGIEAINCHNTSINRNYIDTSSAQISRPSAFQARKTGRNENCPCGSGRKFKKCHGVLNMGIGIKISGMNNTINDNQIKSDEVGIHVEGNKNEILRNNIEIQKLQLVEIIEKLSLPKNLPAEYLLEAINILSKDANASQAPSLLESSNFKNWLSKNGFNMSFWVSTAISLASFIKA